MAIEQLCLLAESGAWDLIVVDTPPTRHALDFLEAPRRLDDFLDRSVIRWFVKPYFSAGWAALQAVNRTATFILRRLEQATGVAALADISDFFTSMSGLFENFHAVTRAAGCSGTDMPSSRPARKSGCSAMQSISCQDGGSSLKGVVMNRVHAELRRGSAGVDPDDPRRHGLVARAVGAARRRRC
jgi:hypothetical protein